MTVEDMAATWRTCVAVSNAMNDIIIFVYSRSSDLADVQLLNEAKMRNLGRGYSVVMHRAHVPGCQDHLHFYRHGAKLYAMNKDGSGHDGSHGVTMDKHTYDAAKSIFPKFTWRTNRLIESWTTPVGITQGIIDRVSAMLDCPDKQTMAALIAEAEAEAVI